MIRSATVSLPVDVYVVVFVPSLMVILPFLTIPKASSEVLVVTDAVPVPVAGKGAGAGFDELVELADEDPVAPFDDEPVVPVPLSTFSTAADSSVLTRLSAVWLAMLARPVARFVMAEPIALMTEAVLASD